MRTMPVIRTMPAAIGGRALSTLRRRYLGLGLRTSFSLAVLLLAGCSLDGLLKSDQLPPNITDPAVTKTPEGALAAYRGLLAQFRVTFGGTISRNQPTSFIMESGLLSDELRNLSGNSVDRRLLPEGSIDGDAPYRLLHLVRADAGQASGLLNAYLPDQPALAGHAYALQGYAEVFLAELFCSGVPLSTVDFDGNYTYRAGSSTTEIFTHARALFDTALALSQDSTRFAYLAALGKARALLGLGDYEGAAAAVAAVPADYRYEVSYASATDITAGVNFAASFNGQWFTAADREGNTGLAYRTDGDPRTTPMSARGTYGSETMYLPTRYAADGSTPLVLASGIEAQLIEAEAMLHRGDVPGWLDTLNRLRTDGTYDVSGSDTLWHAGTGGVAGLPPLSDPSTESARVMLLFRERAFWLFLTGHRQGDLRRLIRQYGQSQSVVYPIGSYPQGGIGALYGSDVTLPVPPAEQTSNPLFTGCLSREA